MINCGHCKGRHATVAEVRACSVTPVDIEAVEREMHEMERAGDLAEARRDAAAKAAKWDRETDLNPATDSAIHELRELLATKDAPDHERRYVQAVKEMLAKGRPSGYAVRAATERVSAWRNVRAGGYGHQADEGRWSSADRERAQAARARETGPDHEGLYKLSRDVTLFDGTQVPAGTMLQVLRGKSSDRLYAATIAFNGATTAKGRPKPDLTYVKGLIFKVLNSELVPVDGAEEFTREHGWCVFGHYLTAKKSIERGMGPVCYERYPHLARNHSAA